MKKIKHIVFLSIILVFTVYSCKKERNNIPKDQNSNYSENILIRIHNFKNTMESSYKAGISTYIDDAVWNLEALICYENAYPDSSSRNFVTYKSYYTLTVDNDS